MPIFQEQLLRIAMMAAGFSGGEAEELRRAMGFKRSVERMEQHRGAAARGHARARHRRARPQEEIVRGITSFALYGFPESHSASFALIAYASAYLKAHHPAAFLAGLLNAQPDGLLQPGHAGEGRPAPRRRGAADRRGRLALAVHAGAGRRGEPAVRIGLRYAAGLRAETGRAIEVEREPRAASRASPIWPGASPCAATSSTRWPSSARSAAIDPAARQRRAALWQVAALERDRSSLFAGISPPRGAAPRWRSCRPSRPPWPTTGPAASPPARTCWPTCARSFAGAASSPPSSSAHAPDGRFVRTAGHVIVRQRPGSAKGFCFLTLEDETGTSNAVLTPDVFQSFRIALHTSPLIEIAGPLQNVDGVIHVRVRELRPPRARRGRRPARIARLPLSRRPLGLRTGSPSSDR